MLLVVRPRILDIAFITALVGSIARLSDFVLDSAQQNKVQVFLNRITERLIDLNLLSWYPRLREYKLNIPIFILIFTVETFAISASSAAKNEKIVAGLRAMQVLDWTSYLTLAGWQFIIYVVMVNLLARVRRTWVFCVSTLLPGILAIPILLLSLLAFLGWATVIVGVHRADPQNISPQTVIIGFWIMLGFVAAAALFFWLAVVFSGLGLLVSGAHLVVTVSRGLLWRVVTHNKGAWTALWLLITGILGVLEVVSHGR